jgi:hypothetical protein
VTAATLPRDAQAAVSRLGGAPVSSRAVRAGIEPEHGVAVVQLQGATRRERAGWRTVAAPTLAWWGDADWLDEVCDAVRAQRDVCRQHKVDPDTVVAVARAHAAFADYRTGRSCAPTNARLVELAQCSLSTVQRARRVLKALALLVEQLRGRSTMTRDERLQAWRRGSSHRRVASVFALCSRRARGAKMGARKQSIRLQSTGARPAIVERDTPPGAWGLKTDALFTSGHLRAETENEEGAPRPLTPKGSAERRAPRLDPAARRLAEATRLRLRWLAGVPVSRLAPMLTKRARAGWTARDVERTAADVLTARGHRVPRDLRQPAAYLAGLLRDVDPADRPGALDDQLRAWERAQREHERQLRVGTPCPHGQPAGDVPSPRGHLACPSCRAAAATDDWPALPARPNPPAVD